MYGYLQNILLMLYNTWQFVNSWGKKEQKHFPRPDSEGSPVIVQHWLIKSIMKQKK